MISTNGLQILNTCGTLVTKYKFLLNMGKGKAYFLGAKKVVRIKLLFDNKIDCPYQ
jgi:hypothetical protein